MFFREYLRIFMPLAVMLAVYRVIAVPFIEPAVKSVIPIESAVVHDRSTPWWNDYFKKGSWQLDQPNMAETGQGTILLFGKLTRLAPDRIRLSPLTILIPQKDEPPSVLGSNSKEVKRRAIVINNPQGTEIQFRGAIDFLGGQLPPVKGGQMIGEVLIFAPPKEGNPQDGLMIESRELRIDRRHIWTTEAVKMKIGNSHVEGRDLSIHLDQDLLSSKDPSSSQTDSPINGLEDLELVYVDRVHIDLPDDGLFAEKSSERTSIHPPRPAHAEVHCKGAFHFDFHQSLATLSTKVELRHLVNGLPPDTFQSDQLYLHFRSNKLAPTSDVSPASSKPNTNEWSIDRIEATGTNVSDPNDPSRWVRVEAPGMNARGQGRWLKVELDRGRIALANHLPGVIPNDSSQVYLQRDNLQVWSPEIEYESPSRLNSDSQKTSMNATEAPLSLGLLWAAGPGHAAVLSEDGDQWRLSWAKSLQLQPDGKSDRLTIDGSANARSERQGRFSADTVDIWLTTLSEKLLAQLAFQSNGKPPSSVLPERMHAAGQVIVNTSELRAQVTDMQFWFSYPEIEAVKQRWLSTASLGQHAKPNTPPLSVRGPGQLAASNMELPNFSSKNPQSSMPVPTLPMNVTGETLVAKLSQTSAGMVIDDLALSGSVTVTRDQVSPTSPMPLTILGSQIRMDSSDEGRLDATIIGTPAKFAIGSGAIESTEIRFNERRQMVWIDQPGSFRIPPEAMQTMTTSQSNTTANPISGNVLTAPELIPSRKNPETAIEWIEAPEIRWQGRMVFDGRIARVDGGVKLNCRMRTDPETIWHIEGNASEMLVELQEPIVIGGDTTKEAKIANIRLRETVDIKAVQTDLKGNRRSLEHLEVPELVLLVPNQHWVGTGPGSLRSKRIGNANPGSPKLFSSSAQEQLPSSLVRNPQAELQCLHLRFRGSMEGDMNQQMVSFQDRVETLIEPILNWDQISDVQLVDRLRVGQTTMMCDQLSVYNTANLSWNQTQIANQQLRRDAAWEVTGAGHVIVESVNEQNAFSVKASRAQYVAIHSMLRIEGAPREAAVFEQTPARNQTGAAPIHGEFSIGAINLKTGENDIQFSKIFANLDGVKAQLNAPATGQPTNLLKGPPNAIPGGYGGSSTIDSPRNSYPLRRP